MEKLKVETMKAVVANGYGTPEILEVKEMPKPSIESDQVLVKVHVSSITRADAQMRAGNPWYGRLFLGFFKRKNPIMGSGYAGVVAEVGHQVTDLQVGDAVFGETTTNFSTSAEFVSIQPNDIILPMPDELSFEEASVMCDGPVTSLNFLKNVGSLKPEQKVLIIGASGSLGSAAVQIAKNIGAEVTGVCSGKNIDYVKSLGADRVINYQVEDFRQTTDGYDLIYDTVGAHSFKTCKKALKEGGTYMSPVLSMSLLFTSLLNMAGKKQAKFAATGLAPKEVIVGLLVSLVEMKKANMLELLIEKRYKMSEIKEAHYYIETGRKKGSLVLDITEG